MFPISVIDNLEFCFEVSLLAVGVGTVNRAVIPCMNSKLLNLELPLLLHIFIMQKIVYPVLTAGFAEITRIGEPEYD